MPSAAPDKFKSRSDLLKLYKRFFRMINSQIKRRHRAGASGLEVAGWRADLLDMVLRDLFTKSLESMPGGGADPPFTLVAVGGYGRGTLNPGSDVDLLFLSPKNTLRLPPDTVELIGDIITMLFDVGLQVGHVVRSIPECIQHANRDNVIKSSMLDLRFVTGDESLAQELEQRFQKSCIKGKEDAYVKVRMDDFNRRHDKYNRTVFLQEPNIKEGCGGLRDYQNVLWLLQVRYGTKDLSYLIDRGLLAAGAVAEMREAHDFLMRTRNEMHYSEGTDILTLRLQGVVATNLGYLQKTILKRIEAFMRDYYQHTRSLGNHCTSVLQSLDLIREDESAAGILGVLARRRQRREEFDGFFSRSGLLFPERGEIFGEDPLRMMRAFRHLQQRGLTLSPNLRKLCRASLGLIDDDFRANKAVLGVFEDIISDKGDVGRILRQMHRVGILGRYLPEFGALELLVQHEFFHRYTADEHTLRTIEQLDALSEPADDSPDALLRKLFKDLEDPFVLYLALILHDTGRAENAKYHDDASVMLATDLCKRLDIRGQRRQRLLFLIDHHLTFWKMATTKDIDDPEVIAEFAGMMRNRANMDTLLVMTCADSRGTNEEAWSTWKASLMFQLHRSTCAYFKDQKAFQQRTRDAKTEILEAVRPQFDESYADEIEAHFGKLPARYFFYRDAEAVARHIQLFRRFIEQTRATEGSESLHPQLNWVPFPDRGWTQLELVGWDRPLLLAKAAGALASRKINILSADIFTRGDDLVLDIFRICTPNFQPITSERDQEAVQQLLNDLLDDSMDLESIAAKIPQPKATADPELLATFPSRVYIANDAHTKYTLVEVQALDRIGLLYDIFSAIGAAGEVQIVLSRISTEKGAAIDAFYLTDNLGQKVTDAAKLDRLQSAVEKVIGLP